MRKLWSWIKYSKKK